MIMEHEIAAILKSFVRGSVATIVDFSLNVCKEIFKFVLVLILLYYSSLWLFQLLDAIVPKIQEPDDIVLAGEKEDSVKPDLDAIVPKIQEPDGIILTEEKEDSVKPDLDTMAHQMVGETYLRIGAPDENLINQRADLLEQLEIEAEFEENLNKHMRSEEESKSSIHENVSPASSNIRKSEEIKSFNNLFISEIERESSETSRPSQTIKTSLGKKSKLREKPDDAPTTTTNAYNDQEESEELMQRFTVERVTEINENVTDSNVPMITEEQSPSSDEQYDHESFYRI